MKVNVERLKAVMQRRKVRNYEELAEMAGLSPQTVYNIATNRNWTRDKIESICKALDCDPRDFVDFERNGNGHTQDGAPTHVNEPTRTLTS